MFSSAYINSASIISISETKKLDAAISVDLISYISHEISRGHKNIIIDLSTISFMDSSALGAIIKIMKSIGTDGKLILVGVHGIVLDLMQLTRVDKILNLQSDIDTAIKNI